MTIDKNLILRLENLARLELNDTERQRLQGSLNDILGMVEQLNALDTEGVEPLIYVNDDTQILREDVAKNEVSQAQALKNAPDQNGTFFKVPKVIDIQ
jgi:aspartyl-tRNA(Asn)/glutamyl-tRNA(Gln) amidotransferase subunit C